MSQASLETGFGAMIAAGSFATAMGSRVFATRGPDSETFPYALWEIITDPPDETFDGDDIDAEVQVDIYHDAQASDTLSIRTDADTLFTQLQNQSISITGFAGGHVQCIERGSVNHDGEAYQHTSRWRVRATKV